MSGLRLYDAVVVGAGPAGCALSLVLAQNGLSVLLLEKETIGRARVCGGFLGPETGPVLARLGLDEAFARLPKNLIREVRISGLHSKPLDAVFGQGNGWAVERARFDAFLGKEAVLAGTEISERSSVIRTRRANGAWNISIQNGLSEQTVCSRLLIFASGRRTPRLPDPSRVFFACKTVYEGIEAPKDRVSLHFVRNGHVGLNPLEDGRVTLCLYVRGDYLKRAKGDLDRMMEDLRRQNACLKREMVRARRISDWSSCVAEPDEERLFFRSGAFFCGDAVSMVHPIVGGGIPIAIESAALLGELLAEAFTLEIPADRTAQRYSAEWGRRFDARAGFARSMGSIERSDILMQGLFAVMGLVPGLFKTLLSHSRPDALRVE